MIGLPSIGQKVKVWPAPGRLVQNGPRPVDRMGGGRFLDAKGEEIIWDEFHHEQMKAGDLILHAPPKEKDAPKAASAEAFDPHKATAAHMKALEDEKKTALPEKVEEEKKQPEKSSGSQK